MKSLYSKISAIFLLLIILAGILGSAIWVVFWQSYRNRSEQILQWRVAADMALQLQPLLESRARMPDVMDALLKLEGLNPRINLYLVNPDGEVVAQLAGIKQPRIDIAPVKRFLEQKFLPEDIIWGTDPASSEGSAFSTVPFSAAAVTINGEPAYLYATLHSRSAANVYNLFGKYEMINIALIWLAISLAVIACLGLLLFAVITRRFRTMTASVIEFAGGNLHTRIDVPSNDEVGELARAFNQMADTIRENVRALEHNDTLRRSLVANISHDLRGPLTCINGFLQTLKLEHSVELKPQAFRYLEVIGNNVSHLRKLSDALFELSKLEAQEAQPVLEEFPIDELADDVLLKFKPIAEQRGIALRLHADPTLPLVRADILLVERALSNLVDNALRYTPPGGSIELRLATDETSSVVHITVSDTGCGIPPEQLPLIFDRFYRVEKDRSKETGGSGLGLAIVKRIVEAHGGPISVESRVGEGTAFSFALSCADGKAPA